MVLFTYFLFQEEVASITMSKYRKAQQSIEEAEHRADMVERSMTMRHSSGPGMRSISVTREVTSTMRGNRSTSIL